MLFKNTPEQKSFSMENQQKCIYDFGKEEIEDFLLDMFVTPDQFVTLTSPKVQGTIRYVQARADGDEVEVELGIEEEGGTRLYYRMCSDEICMGIFMDFYDGKLAVDMSEYQPVQF